MKPFEAAPLPWKSDEPSIIDANGKHVAGVVHGAWASDIDLAAEVVRRVNTHDALVKALTEAATALRNAGSDLSFEYPTAAERYLTAATSVEASLKAAKGKS